MPFSGKIDLTNAFWDTSDIELILLCTLSVEHYSYRTKLFHFTSTIQFELINVFVADGLLFAGRHGRSYLVAVVAKEVNDKDQN